MIKIDFDSQSSLFEGVQRISHRYPLSQTRDREEAVLDRGHDQIGVEWFIEALWLNIFDVLIYPDVLWILHKRRHSIFIIRKSNLALTVRVTKSVLMCMNCKKITSQRKITVESTQVVCWLPVFACEYADERKFLKYPRICVCSGNLLFACKTYFR